MAAMRSGAIEAMLARPGLRRLTRAVDPILIAALVDMPRLSADTEAVEKVGGAFKGLGAGLAIDELHIYIAADVQGEPADVVAGGRHSQRQSQWIWPASERER